MKLFPSGSAKLINFVYVDGAVTTACARCGAIRVTARGSLFPQ